MLLKPQTLSKIVQSFTDQDVNEQESIEDESYQSEDSSESEKLDKRGKLKYSAMISYCNTNWELVNNLDLHLQSKKIKSKLLGDKSVYPGSLDKIKSRIQNAEVIVICFSETYKRSMICRIVAFCAKRLSKKLLFVRVQPDYIPTDWLDNLIGSSPYFDLYGALYETHLRKIVATIKGLPTEDEEPQCKNWTERQVLEWSTENQLEFLQQEY